MIRRCDITVELSYGFVGPERREDNNVTAATVGFIETLRLDPLWSERFFDPLQHPGEQHWHNTASRVSKTCQYLTGHFRGR
jgi:hypothetical protein